MKHGKFMVKTVCFVLTALIAVSAVNTFLTPKYLYNEEWASTQTINDFYRLEKNSIDVLFLGSSHGVTAFSPMRLYEKYGITAFNLGIEQQNLMTTYYWLKEALRYQKPKAIVVESFFMHEFAGNGEYNINAKAVRKSFEYMKWSPVKIEAINDFACKDSEIDKRSFYLPQLQYHTRWTDLKEDDFLYNPFAPHPALMGYSALIKHYIEEQEYATFSAEDMTGAEVNNPLDSMVEYMDKVLELCKENDIEVILSKTPSTAANIGRYAGVMEYCTSRGIKYVDFNEESVYNAAGYSFYEDNDDYGHLNVKGAVKVTDYIGDILVNEYGFTGHSDEQFEENMDYYHNILDIAGVHHIDDVYEYLDKINDDQYVVFISLRENDEFCYDDRLRDKMSAIGFALDLTEGKVKSGYAVINGDKVNTAMSDLGINSKGTIRNGAVSYEIASAGQSCGDYSEIKINGKEYSKGERGINIVVYCLDWKKVIDSVCFETGENFKAIR